MTAETSEVTYVPDRENTWRFVPKHFAIFLVLMSVWELANRMGLADPLMFPRPTRIAEGMLQIFFLKATVWEHLAATFAKAMGGFLIGTAIGMGLAIGAALHTGFRDYLKPYIILVEAMPRIAVGPIFVGWLGFGYGSAIALAALVCFFGPFVNTMTGLMQIDEESEELFRSCRASKKQIFFKLMVPNAMPLISAGLKLAAAGGFAGALVAEFIQADVGLGVMMRRYVITLNMDYAFSTLLSITVFAFVLFRSIEIMNYRIIYWHSEELMQRKSKRRASEFAGIINKQVSGTGGQ